MDSRLERASERAPFFVAHGNIYLMIPGSGYARLSAAAPEEYNLRGGRFRNFRTNASREFKLQKPGSIFSTEHLAEQIEWISETGGQWHLEYPQFGHHGDHRNLLYTYMWFERESDAIYHKLRFL